MGLMPTPTQGNQTAAPDPAQGGQDQGQDEQPNVSPEEQKMYDTVMEKAGDIIYGKGKVMPEILKSLEPAKDAPSAGPPDAPPDASSPDAESAPEDQAEGGEGSEQAQGAKGNPAVLALANTATQVVNKLDTSSREQGFTIPDDVLYHAGSEIVGMLAEVAETAGFHDYSEDEINGAFYQAIDNYRPIAEKMGRTDNATLQQQFGEIEQADQQGKLGEILPGMESQPQAPASAPES